MTSMNRIAAVTAALLMLAGVTGFLSLTGFISGSENQDSQRSAPVQSAADRAVFQLQQRLASEPNDLAAVDGLGSAYLQKARESGDPAFYTKAVGLFDKAMTMAPDDQTGIIGASMAAAARHDFARALQLAQQAVRLDPEDPDAQGVLGDALVELRDIRPDLLWRRFLSS